LKESALNGFKISRNNIALFLCLKMVFLYKILQKQKKCKMTKIKSINHSFSTLTTIINIICNCAINNFSYHYVGKFNAFEQKYKIEQADKILARANVLVLLSIRISVCVWQKFIPLSHKQ
jgi:hypothetical protein